MERRCPVNSTRSEEYIELLFYSETNQYVILFLANVHFFFCHLMD